MKTVIVYGPPACGKTLNSETLKARLGCARLVDGWMPGNDVIRGALHMTNEKPDILAARGAQVMPFEKAMIIPNLKGNKT